MAFTIAEIEGLVKDKYDQNSDLRTRWERDYDFWRLKPYNRGADYKSFTSNKPRTLADLIIDFIVRSKRQIRIPLDQEVEGERQNLSNAERLLIGLLNTNDLRLGSLVQPTLVEQMAFFAVIRGWFGLRVYVTKDNKGATKPHIDVWDLYNTQYDIGGDGLLWVCHTRTATASQIKAEYNVDIKSKKAEIFDWWDTENNSIHIKGHGEFLKKAKHGVEHTPCLIIAVGSVPPIESITYTNKIATDRDLAGKYPDINADRGESWIAPNRGLIVPKNELFSDWLTIVSRGAKVPLKFEYDSNKGGQPQLDQSPYKLDKGQVGIVYVDKGKGQDLLPLIEPTMPKDAAVVANIINVEEQEGGVPNAAYGQLPFQVSGYLYSRLQEAISKAINPPLAAIERAGDWLLRELLHQFSAGGFKPTRVEGRDSKDQYFGPVTLKPSDVKGDWFPEFRLTPRLPEDEMERFAMARIAHEGPNPLLSDQSINDRILKIQDTDLEEEIKVEEWGLRLPPIRLRRLANIFMRRGRPDLAQEVLSLLTQELPTMGARPRTEAKQPEFATGVPPEVMPPEQLGRPPQTPPTGGVPIE